jgi:hypothetical protein
MPGIWCDLEIYEISKVNLEVDALDECLYRQNDEVSESNSSDTYFTTIA